MIVYRIENKKGIGPYKNFSWDFWDSLPKDRPRLKGSAFPEDDFGVWFMSEIYEKLGASRRNVFFGCPSKQSLLDWFGIKDEAILNDTGFFIKEYGAEKFVISNSGKQVMFVKPSKLKRNLRQMFLDATSKIFILPQKLVN